MKNTLIIFALIFLSACATYKFKKEPVSIDDTLTMGRITLKVVNSTKRALPEGEFYWGMTAQLKNLSSGKISKIESLEEGYFFTHNLKPGNYKVQKITFRISSKARGSGSIWVDPTNKDIFKIYAGKVNNLGNLSWTANIDGGERYTSFFTEHEKVKAFFATQNTSSKWLKKEWVNIKRN